MRRLVVLIVFSFGLFSGARAQSGVRDSIIYYQNELNKIYRASYDSLQKSDGVVENTRKLRHFEGLSRSYTALSVFGEVAAADFGSFNKSIAASGFGPLHGPNFRGGFGISHKGYSGVMIDFNFFSAAFDRKSVKGDERIGASFSDFFQLHLGYAVVSTRMFNVYPYAGLSFRASQLTYDAPVTTNPNYTSIVDIIQHNSAYTATSTRLGYQAGLGIDWVIGLDNKGYHGIILFNKTGTDGAFGGDESYKIEGIKYTPGIRMGNWVSALGVKLF